MAIRGSCFSESVFGVDCDNGVEFSISALSLSAVVAGVLKKFWKCDVVINEYFFTFGFFSNKCLDKAKFLKLKLRQNVGDRWKR